MIPAQLRIQSLDYQCPQRGTLIPACPVTDGCYITAGERIGPFSVQVLDESGESVPAALLTHCTVQMAIADDDENTLMSASSDYSEARQYWFKEYEGLSRAGSYFITFALTSDDASDLPSLKIPFQIIPCPEIAYIQTPKPTECFRIGDQFDISLTLMDQFDNAVENARQEFRSSIVSTGMDFSVTRTVTEDGEVRLEGVIAIGKIDELSERTVPLVMIEAEVCLWPADSPQSEEPLFRVKIQLKFKAGAPETLVLVDPAGDEKCVIENGTLPQFGVRVLDAFGNMVTTAIEPKLAITVSFGEYTATGGRKDWPGDYSLSFMTGPNGSPCLLKGGSTLKVDLDDRNEKMMFARLSLNNFAAVKPVLRDIFVQKCAKPSDIRIFCSSEYDPDTTCEIRNGETMNWTAAQMIRNVSFKMMDEEKNVIAKPNLTMSNFRVSWFNADWVPSCAYNIKSLNAGKLPDVRAPKNDGEVAQFSVTFYEASAGPTVRSLSSRTDDSSISFQFSIKATVGVPVSLAASISGCGETRIRSAAVMERFIVVHAQDSCGNRITDISAEDVNDLTITPTKGTLDPETLSKEPGFKSGEIYVKGIKVEFDEDLPSLELEIKFLSLTTTLSLDVMAGLPAKLEWIMPKNAAYDPHGHLLVMNRVPAGQWSVQVKDKFSKETKFAGLVVALGVSKRTEVKAETQKPITNSEGIASFGFVRITAKDTTPPAASTCRCRSLCYGVVPVQAKIDFQGVNIITAPIRIHLKCDPRRVTGFVVMIDGAPEKAYGATVTAGSQFPEFAVSLVAEDGSTVTDPDILSTVLMISLGTDATSSQKSFVPPNYLDEVAGKALFQKLIVPYQAGEYAMSFLIKQQGREDFHSETFFYKVVAATPRTFRPVKFPNDVWVSNTTDRSKRMIVHGLRFVLEDEFRNVVPDTSGETESDRYSGTLNVKLEASKESITTLPELESCGLSFPISGGKATSEPLFLSEKTAGENGAAYKVTFQADFPALDIEIPDFSISFNFVDDSRKHEQLSILKTRKETLSHEKGVLSQDYALMDREYQHMKQVLLTLSDQMQTRQSEVVSQISGLRLKIREGTLSEFDSLVRDAESALSHLISATSSDPNSKRVAPAAEQPGVIGRIIHLGRAQNDEDVSIISWIMISDMKCIVTDTTIKALQLTKSEKKQQVLPLDMIREIVWDEPMPHETCDPPFHPEGKPVFARHLLYFPEQEKKCRAAFGSLLSDTIVIATLEDAVSYRQTLLQKGRRCPALVTRSGEKITSAGKFVPCPQVGPSDPKMMRFHRVPVREIGDCQKRLAGLRELRDLSDAKDQAIMHLQTFDETHGLRFKQVGERLADLDQQLKGIEQQEVEISRKRPSSNLDSPAFKRFC